MEGDISWGEREPHEAEALRSLVEAEACLRQARLKGSRKLFSRAIKHAEKAIQSFPWSVIAHYISAVAHLRGLGDKNYAQQKYDLLLTLKSEEAHHVAKQLHRDIKETQGKGGGAPSQGLSLVGESSSASLPPPSQKT